MGVEIKLTDKQLPVSPVFVDFLYRRIHAQVADASWQDQVSETLVPGEFGKRLEHARGVAEEVLAHPLGQKVIYRAYELFTALVTGDELPGEEAGKYLASTGLGLRLSYGKSVSLRVDIAQILKAHGTRQTNEQRVSAGVAIIY